MDWLCQVHHVPGYTLVYIYLRNADLVYPFRHWTPHTTILNFDSYIGDIPGSHRPFVSVDRQLVRPYVFLLVCLQSVSMSQGLFVRPRGARSNVG